MSFMIPRQHPVKIKDKYLCLSDTCTQFYLTEYKTYYCGTIFQFNCIFPVWFLKENEFHYKF
jgi:hypothetical protein